MSPMFEIWARPDYRGALVSLGLSPASAESVARAWPDPVGLLAATTAQLARHGVTPRLARRLLGAVDLAKLAHRPPVGPEIRHARDVYAVVGPPFSMAEHEIIAVVMLNTRQRVIDVSTLSQGSPRLVTMVPGDLYRGAIRAAAAAIILAHNHPSGDPRPSRADVELTERVRDAGNLVGIPLLDHLVIARGGEYCSLAAEGLGGLT
jgi:DNA repair protein RadC